MWPFDTMILLVYQKELLLYCTRDLLILRLSRTEVREISGPEKVKKHITIISITTLQLEVFVFYFRRSQTVTTLL